MTEAQECLLACRDLRYVAGLQAADLGLEVGHLTEGPGLHPTHLGPQATAVTMETVDLGHGGTGRRHGGESRVGSD